MSICLKLFESLSLSFSLCVAYFLCFEQSHFSAHSKRKKSMYSFDIGIAFHQFLIYGAQEVHVGNARYVAIYFRNLELAFSKLFANEWLLSNGKCMHTYCVMFLSIAGVYTTLESRNFTHFYSYFHF